MWRCDVQALYVKTKKNMFNKSLEDGGYRNIMHYEVQTMDSTT